MYTNLKNYKYVNLEKLSIKQEIAGLIPKEIAIKYCVISFAIKDNKVCVAMVNPENKEILSYLKLVCKKEIIVYKASEQIILSSIEVCYEKVNAAKALFDLESIRAKDDHISNSENRNEEIANAPAVQITEYIINKAIAKRASDIHLEPFSDAVYIRYRTDGVLFDELNISLGAYRAVSTRIKIMSNMDISEKRCPQDGKIEYNFSGEKYDLRVSSLPTIYGEKFVIRILYKSSKFCNLKGINFREKEFVLMKKILGKSHGMILVTGPTGSGKTTTLYAMLNELNNRQRNIITIEDPVEYSMEGINQVNVNPKAKITFASGLRSILRQDPDIIMIGEIRDEETAAIAVRAAITGHLVIATLHTNDAVGAIPRLIEMGVERYLLADCLIAVIAQRLVRKICTNCAEEYIPSESEKRRLSIDNSQKLYKGNGCLKCNKSGYNGRCAVCEILLIDEVHRRLILKDDSIEQIKEYSSKNINFLSENCKELVLNGITSYSELVKLDDRYMKD